MSPAMATEGPVLPSEPFQYRDDGPTFHPSWEPDFEMKSQSSIVRTTAIHDQLQNSYPQPHLNRQRYPISRDFVPALEAPVLDRASVNDARPTTADAASMPERPTMYNLPRRLSATSNVSEASFATSSSTRPSRESMESRTRARSFNSSSRTSFESIPSANPTKRPPFLQQSQSYHPWQLRRPALPAPRRQWKVNEQFTALPGEVLGLILAELKKLHLGSGSSSCATCWMRDCCSLILTARKWSKFARAAL